MNIVAKKPIEAFNFNEAVGAWFKTPGGKDYALRLWFWHSMAIFILFIITLPMLLPFMGEMFEASWAVNQATFSGREPDVAPLLDVFVKLIPGYTILLIGFLLVSSLGEAALYRKYLLGAEPAKIPLRLDRHAFRNMGVQIGFYLLFMAIYAVGLFLVILVGGGVAAMAPALGGFLLVIGIIALLLALIAFPVKYAPSAALSHLDGKSHLLATRHVTKHRFWPLFGAYIVTYIGGYVAYYIIYVLVVALVTGDPNFMMIMSGLSSVSPVEAFQAAAERIKNPLIMIIGVLGVALMSAAWSAWMLWIAGVSAYAVKWWASDSAGSAEVN